MNVVSDVGLSFAVLGPLRAQRGSAPLALGSPQQQAVLAGLLLRTGNHTSVDELVHALWGDAPPRTATSTVRTYVSRLRTVLESERTDTVLTFTSGGYLLRVPPDRLDLAQFTRLTRQATTAAAEQNPARAAQLLRQALRLWTGSALAGLPGPYAGSQRHRLHQLRSVAVEDWLAAEIDLGNHGAALADLVMYIAENPFQERLWQLRMVALHRGGRRADALAAYDQVRRLLAAELGVDPGPLLRRTHRRILAADGTLTATVSNEAHHAYEPQGTRIRGGGDRDHRDNSRR